MPVFFCRRLEGGSVGPRHAPIHGNVAFLKFFSLRAPTQPQRSSHIEVRSYDKDIKRVGWGVLFYTQTMKLTRRMVTNDKISTAKKRV